MDEKIPTKEVNLDEVYSALIEVLNKVPEESAAGFAVAVYGHLIDRFKTINERSARAIDLLRNLQK